MTKTTPLDSIKHYLWEKCKSHPPETDLHAYYLQGWELVSHLKMLLFQASSAHGLLWPFAINGALANRRHLFTVHCQANGCTELPECLLNKVRTGKKIRKYGRTEHVFAPLPNAPVFYCYPHGQEADTGEKYVPPTAEEQRHLKALLNAMDRISDEIPATSLDLGNGLKVDRHVTMDRSYLERLMELVEEENRKLIHIN